MKLGILFSGGKDSCYAAYLAKQEGNELVCLISILSENLDSYMFHTPNIKLVEKQAKVMELPIVIKWTKGVKEKELKELELAISEAKEKYGIEGIVTGALHSDYQATRIQKICDKLELKCINPLWHKDEFEYLQELINNKFKVIITCVAGEGLDDKWLGREIDNKFVEDVKILHDKYKIHPAGEGGEFESFVIGCPLFKKELKIIDKNISGEGNSWKMEVKIK